jgi:hypothetical protein
VTRQQIRQVVAVFAVALVSGMAVGLTASACANKRHAAVVVDVALYQGLADLHAAEQTALCGQVSCADTPREEFVKGWTLAKSQDFNRKLLPAVEAGRQFNKVLAAWQPGAPMPQGLSIVIVSVGDALAEVTKDFPEGTTKTAVLAQIGQVQGMILNALNLYLGGWR